MSIGFDKQRGMQAVIQALFFSDSESLEEVVLLHDSFITFRCNGLFINSNSSKG